MTKVSEPTVGGATVVLMLPIMMKMDCGRFGLTADTTIERGVTLYLRICSTTTFPGVRSSQISLRLARLHSPGQSKISEGLEVNLATLGDDLQVIAAISDPDDRDLWITLTSLAVVVL